MLREKIIEEILNISEYEVAGLVKRNDKQLMIKVTTKEKYNEICYNFSHRKIPVAADHVIQVEDISTFRIRVLVRDVPLEVNNDTLKELLEKFGEVSKISYMRKKYKCNKWNNVATDRRIVWMTLEHPIPSSLYINQTKTYIYVYHDNQPQSCNRCGQDDHFRKDCRVKFRDWTNIVDIDVSGYDLDSESENEDEQEVFECLTCEHKCTDRKSFDEHLGTHTAQNEEKRNKTNSESDSIGGHSNIM